MSELEKYKKAYSIACDFLYDLYCLGSISDEDDILWSRFLGNTTDYVIDFESFILSKVTNFKE